MDCDTPRRRRVLQFETWRDFCLPISGSKKQNFLNLKKKNAKVIYFTHRVPEMTGLRG